LRNQSGVPFASLSISAISSRMADRRVQELAVMLRNESRLIERQIANGMEIR
jgi:DNA-binding IclR family transcriptional regulator